MGRTPMKAITCCTAMFLVVIARCNVITSETALWLPHVLTCGTIVGSSLLKVWSCDSLLTGLHLVGSDRGKYGDSVRKF